MDPTRILSTIGKKAILCESMICESMTITFVLHNWKKLFKKNYDSLAFFLGKFHENESTFVCYSGLKLQIFAGITSYV